MPIPFKRFLPTNLFARALLILVLPMLISQLVIAHIFYDRHWSSVSRNMANAMVGDVVWLYQTYRDARDQGMDTTQALASTDRLAKQLKISLSIEPEQAVQNGQGKRLYPDYFAGLDERIEEPVAIDNDAQEALVHTRIATEDGVLVFDINRKSLTSPTTLIFMLWMVGSSALLTLIAVLFLRNQIRPIVQLARAAERLGLGQDVADFKPRGASEVRRAGRAFLIMADRIRRQVQNRTEMLAGISHDLRTPLTRMKLALELSKLDPSTRSALTADIDEMGKMIDEYLSFARGDAGEIAEPIELNWLLSDVVADYKRGKRAVQFTKAEPIELMIRPMALRRALMNLIDNALRYGGGEAQLVLEPSATFVRIKITDHGPGIPDSDHETVFKPFTRLEPSRNSSTGGVGLGLSIARAIAQSHGGDVTLENQRGAGATTTGLEVTLRLPRAVQPAQ